MIEATLSYLLRQNPRPEVLLGFKKTGFGVGKIDGIGGKLEAGETPAEGAVRELAEETGVRVDPSDLVPVGDISFLFAASRPMEHHVFLFLVRRWVGEPAETEEIRPAWFSVGALPWEGMWADAPHWLPGVLRGEGVRGEITFQIDNEHVASVALRPSPSTRP